MSPQQPVGDKAHTITAGLKAHERTPGTFLERAPITALRLVTAVADRIKHVGPDGEGILQGPLSALKPFRRSDTTTSLWERGVECRDEKPRGPQWGRCMSPCCKSRPNCGKRWGKRLLGLLAVDDPPGHGKVCGRKQHISDEVGMGQ